MYKDRATRRKLNVAEIAKAPAMINNPTVVPSEGAGGGSGCAIPTDPYISIAVDTTDVGIVAPELIILFDSSQGYQLANKVEMDPLVKITRLTSEYQFILNDLVSNGSFFDTFQQRISDVSKALLQYGRPIEIYEASKGSKPRLVQTIHSGMGIHEGQYNKDINTFAFPILVGNRTAFVYWQEPGIVMTWGMYQKAEVGRIK